MRKLKTKWKRLGEAVYENENGFRVHLLGYAKRDGRDLWPFANDLWIKSRNMQPNHKRQVMQWAELMEENSA